jgi:hypothetical protein
MIMFVLVSLLGAARPQALTVEHLLVTAPDDYEIEKTAGPDFAVYHIHPKGSNSPALGMYLGNFPSAFAPEQGTQRAPFQLGRRKTDWTLWQTSDGGVTTFHAEVLLDRPFGGEPPYATRLHLFLSATSEASLRSLQAVATGIRPRQAHQPSTK